MLPNPFRRILFAATLALLTAACVAFTPEQQAEDLTGEDPNDLVLPEMSAVQVDGTPLRVIATTSVIGDVVARVGGDRIDLTTLMAPGQDPHSYQPTAQDLAQVSEAHVIFVNGWGLEEGLLNDLVAVAGDVPLVPISAGIEPIASGDDDQDHEEDHPHGAPNPHVWLSVRGVEQWVRNAAEVLGALDPEGQEVYNTNAAAYLRELDALEADIMAFLAALPEEERVLVTNHDALAYFARDYGFTILGTVIPGKSSLAEPSSADLAALIDLMRAQEVCSIFTETSVSSAIAETVAAELDRCESVAIVPLYTGSLGPPGSGADTYIGMMRTNVDRILAAIAP